MKPRIAIPLPHGGDPEYAERAIPQYERAVELAGGEAVRIPLDRSPAEVMKLIERCDAVLLPGSKADVDPAKFDAPRHPKTEAADPKRDTVDELLLQDAYNMRKPILGICYGLQILNVYRSGTLVQHIESNVNHEAGRKVPVAHTVEIDPGSKLAEIVGVSASNENSTPGIATWRQPQPESLLGQTQSVEGQPQPVAGQPQPRSTWGRAPSPVRSSEARHELRENIEASTGKGPASSRAGNASTRTDVTSETRALPVNSSHHQSADVIGDGLRIVARCPDDGIIEALEGTSPDHFVLAVQWHPERSVDDDDPSRRIFRALVEAAREKHQELAGEFEQTL
jgi:putative glutamine amidotransferase